MKKLWFVVLMCAVATVPAVAQETTSPQTATAVAATKGKMLVAADGARIGAVYRVSPDGSAQVIIDGKMVTIPAATLSTVSGKLTTSLTKHEVMERR